MYEEMGKSAYVGGEWLLDGSALEPATLRAWNDGLPIAEEQKEQIVARIIAALESQGMHVDIV